MIFSSAIFLLFFTTIFLTQWFLLPILVPERHQLRVHHIFLLLASYVFYMTWDWRFGFLIAFSTIIDYFAGRLLATDLPPARRRFALIVSLCVNLGVLCYFKYADFFIASFIETANWLTPSVFTADAEQSLLLNVILPLGISFFTFQSMSYTIDVYRRVIPVERSFIRFALFVSFFPQLVAGPIVTAKEFLPQLQRLPEFDIQRMRTAARWFALGFFKKSILADHMAPVVDLVYSNPAAFDTAGHWLAAWAFWVQIYCDFSGYSDMAWGTAIFLGYHLPENFRLPYLSRSITELWRRWHISLISWIQNYLYIPLGGSRVSFWRHKFNIFFTMFLAGLWHGANWTFVAWGSIHGLILAAESAYQGWLKSRAKTLPANETGLPLLGSWIIAGLQMIATTFLAITTVTIFRSQSIGDAILVLSRLLMLENFTAPSLQANLYRPVGLGVLAVVVGHALGYFIFERKTFRKPPPAWAEILLYPVLILFFMQLSPDNAAPFIYFVF